MVSFHLSWWLSSGGLYFRACPPFVATRSPEVPAAPHNASIRMCHAEGLAFPLPTPLPITWPRDSSELWFSQRRPRASGSLIARPVCYAYCWVGAGTPTRVKRQRRGGVSPKGNWSVVAQPGGTHTRQLMCFVLPTWLPGFAPEAGAALKVVTQLTCHLR